MKTSQIAQFAVVVHDDEKRLGKFSGWLECTPKYEMEISTDLNYSFRLVVLYI